VVRKRAAPGRVTREYPAYIPVYNGVAEMMVRQRRLQRGHHLAQPGPGKSRPTIAFCSIISDVFT